jgi:hypothetical protein
MMMLSKPIALLFLLATFGTTLTFAFPSFSGANDGLEDLSARWWRDKPEHKIKVVQNPPPPPGPPKFTGTKLVNDRRHPWKPVKAGDIRGPCPALNALANHGVSAFIPPVRYSDSRVEVVSISREMVLPAPPRSSTPFKKVVWISLLSRDETHQHFDLSSGFNANNKFAILLTYIGHLLDGNLETDLLSIGRKTRRTGPSPPPPAFVGGLNVHNTFEGMYPSLSKSTID